MQNEIHISLINKCLAKDRQAQRTLYTNLLPYLEMIGKRYLYNQEDLKDVLQDSFVHVFRKLEQFDPMRASFKTWATRITINNCIKHNNKHAQKATIELVVNLHESAVNSAVLDALTNEELLQWLKAMPAQYLEVFNLHAIDGYSHDEIANMLNISTALSRKRLSRARDWLKKRVSDESSIANVFSKSHTNSV